MAGWDRSEHTTRTVEYVTRDGSAIGELMSAHRSALAEYRQVNGLADEAFEGDDWATVHATDDGVVIRFTGGTR